MWTIFVLRRRRAGGRRRGDNDVDAAVQPDEGDADVDYETPCQCHACCLGGRGTRHTRPRDIGVPELFLSKSEPKNVGNSASN